MSQVRKSEKPNRFRQLLRQDIQKKLTLSNSIEEESPRFRNSRARAQGRRWPKWALALGSSTLILLGIVFSSCQHTPDVIPEPEKNKSVFEADEKIILKAIARVLKDKGFGEAKIETEKSRLETDYTIQEDWRTKVEASVKKLNRKEREVTLSVLTEKKTSSGWKYQKILQKEQYDKLFYEIDLQIYREMSQPE